MQAELERLATGGAPARGEAEAGTTSAWRPGDQCFLDRARPRPDPASARHPTGPPRRPAETCAGIWRDALNDYLGRLNQPEIPDDLGPILRLYAHLRATDPETGSSSRTAMGAVDGLHRRAVGAGDGCGSCRCCSSGPAAQGRGLGRQLLARGLAGRDRRGPAPAWRDRDRQRPADLERAVRLARDRAADAAPATRRPGRSTGRRCRRCPTGIEALRFDEVDGGADGLPATARSPSWRTSTATLLGVRPCRGPRLPRAEGRRGFLFRNRDGGVVGYGYAAESGRVGPVAVRDEALLAPVLGHLVPTVRPRGAFGGVGAGQRRRRPSSRCSGPGFRFDGLPGPALLGPAVRRLRPLPADLARASSSTARRATR